jgi:hypothetical protein
MDLIPELMFHFSVGESIAIGGVPSGTRLAVAMVDGWAKGDRITGRLVGPAADWPIVGPDGFAQIDVRAQIRTDDGADLYIHYEGSLEMSDAVMAASTSDGETGFGDQYWYTHVRLESGAEAYQWVNRTLFVGQGRMATDGIEYVIYRLA